MVMLQLIFFRKEASWVQVPCMFWLFIPRSV